MGYLNEVGTDPGPFIRRLGLEHHFIFVIEHDVPIPLESSLYYSIE